jgi:pumilio RNA-binding family
LLAQHVEQLLRTLNLNSPAPFAHHKPYPLAMSVETSQSSPDFSPASASSALLTPTDLSPTGKSFDVKLHSPYEHTHSAAHPYLTQTSLIFDSHANGGNVSPVKNQDILASNVTASRPPLVQLNQHRHHGHHAPQGLNFFEPFAETTLSGRANAQNQNIYSSPPSELSQPLYSSPPPPRRADVRLLPMDWRLNQQLQGQQQHQQHHHQHSPITPDWRLAPHDKTSVDYAFNLAPEEPLRSSFTYKH